jgi:carbonic anhydrase
MISAREALERLREGNGRFVADVRNSITFTSQAVRHELTAGQEPFAIILGCSDSRVPAEIVFDQGLGDCHPCRQKHRRRFTSRQRRVRRGAVRANFGVSASHLRHESEILEHLIERDGLVVVGAEYSLETGAVDFFNGVPGAG